MVAAAAAAAVAAAEEDGGGACAIRERELERDPLFLREVRLWGVRLSYRSDSAPDPTA